MASVSIKSLCRRAIATLPPRRLADPEAAAAFRRGWDEGADRRIQVPPVRRVTMVRTSSNLRGASSTLENGRGQAVVSTDRPPQRHSAQTGTNESPRNADHNGMAPSTVVPCSCSDGIEDDQVGAASGGSVDRSTPRQPILESRSVGSEPRQTRSGTRVNLAMGHRMQTVAGSSRGARAAAILMTEYAWNDRTLSSRNSQWQAWLEFCASESRTPLSATEAHSLAFIGWLKVEREAGRRNVGSASIPQYLSAVRQMQVAMTGQAVPSYLLIGHALRGYARWEEENFPQEAVRCGIDPVQAHRIWGLGISSTSLSVIRNAAMCVFAYCFNGLRDSSVVSIKTQYVELLDSSMTVRLSVGKGKKASQVAFVTYENNTALSSPFDLFRKWNSAPGAHPRYFALPDEMLARSRGGLNDAFKNCVDLLEIVPPLQGKFTSHSLRIGSYTEQVLLRILVEERLAKFGWGQNSQGMANLYFDRRIRSTALSYRFFGCYV